MKQATSGRQFLSLNEMLKSNGIDLTVLPGGDVRVDERICQLLEADKILTLADGGKYILLELPHQVFLDIEPLLADLSSMGIQSIISHPERHPVLSKPQRGSFGSPSWSEQSWNSPKMVRISDSFANNGWKFARSVWSSGSACRVAFFEIRSCIAGGNGLPRP